VTAGCDEDSTAMETAGVLRRWIESLSSHRHLHVVFKPWFKPALTTGNSIQLRLIEKVSFQGPTP